MNIDYTKLQGVSLSVRGLRKSYHGVEVLKDVDFEIKPGEIFVIMGPSGGGKSVMLRQIIGLEDPDAGKILIEGQPFHALDGTARFRVAMVFQSGALLSSMTVGENVGFYLVEHHLKQPSEIAKIVAQELAQVGLKGSENKMPDELSGGMKKRVAIARALVIEPQLILYDEPTSELDPLSSVNIAEEIVKLNDRIHATTLVVSHDRDLAYGIGHRIAILDDGSIIAIGTPDEIKHSSNPRVRQFIDARIPPKPNAPTPVQSGLPVSF